MSGNIGSNGSGFQSGSPGNIRRELFTIDDFVFQERIDCSNVEKPTVDLDVLGVKHSTLQTLFGDTRHTTLND